MIPDDVFEKYKRAGEIAARVRDEMKRLLREGMLIIEICEKAEEMIEKMGGKPAFPCNVSVNEIAAHYSSPPEDTKRIPENSLVKIDVGVHVDGYIGDTAVTVCYNPEYEGLVSAAEEALRTAVQTIRPGLRISKFGSEVQRAIKNRGFKPISNLTGHQVGRYLIHAGKALPNVSHLSTAKIYSGEVYAVEPFVTLPDAAGKVREGDEAYIFRFVKHRSLKNVRSRGLLKYIEKNFRTLPFSERWLRSYMHENWYHEAFSELLSTKSLMSYPIFVEASGKPVAQAEHTVLVCEKGAVILT
ncbi:MAG: type II methionyl aminopeptidase [Candidatus Bathyarchaeia archaeon]